MSLMDLVDTQCPQDLLNLEEAETNIKEAIEAYLESLAERRENFPLEEKTFSGEIQVLANSR